MLAWVLERTRQGNVADRAAVAPNAAAAARLGTCLPQGSCCCCAGSSGSNRGHRVPTAAAAPLLQVVGVLASQLPSKPRPFDRLRQNLRKLCHSLQVRP